MKCHDQNGHKKTTFASSRLIEILGVFSLSLSLQQPPLFFVFHRKKNSGKKALAIAQAGSDYDPALYASKVDEAIASAKGNVMVFS